jgi:hypothetical protein
VAGLAMMWLRVDVVGCILPGWKASNWLVVVFRPWELFELVVLEVGKKGLG